MLLPPLVSDMSWFFPRAWLEALLAGFEIGGMRFSPARALTAVLVFAALLFVFGTARRWLGRAILAPPRVEAGVAHSILTVAGYAGYAVAALAALSVAGVNVTNLAIVAGALSVGIGFGLQSLAGNFVSGLILLVERPIEAGDWITAGGHRGAVRRIGVRATEIETLDQGRVIVPNSELVTSSVVNWSASDARGGAAKRSSPPPVEMIVRAAVGHGADPDRVLAVLRDAAHGVPLVARVPAPAALFDAIGASALEFSVRAYAAPGADARMAETALRCAAVQALRDAGIALARPAWDIHLRDLDPVRALLARLSEERARQVPPSDLDRD